MSNPSSLPSSAAINLRRLVGLRAIALAGLALALWFAVVDLHMALPVRALVCILATAALATLATWLRLQRPWPVRDAELFAQLALDAAALTALFYFAGGWTNPFVLLYLLPLTVSAAALPGAYTWAMAGVTVACYTFLMFRHVPLPAAHGAPGHDFDVHVAGMWAGFVLSAALIAFYVVRMGQTLRRGDRLLAEMRENELRNERLVALATLATGAAHELGTPLSTMAVIVKDMQQHGKATPEKLGTLRGQIDRCKEILGSLTAAAGQVRAEGGKGRRLDEYLEEIVAKWRPMRPAVSLVHRFEGPRPPPRILAEQTLYQAILNILNNAADASPHEVEVLGRWTQDYLTLEVCDRGPGLPAAVERSARQPFFTTKKEGLGLGLFLAYAAVERLGGEVALFNRAGGGACCRLILPLMPLKVIDDEG